MIAACDGACKRNPGPAAWAWVLADASARPVRWAAGALGQATNNIAELTALARLLESTDPAVPLEIRLDSTYTRDAVTKWLPGWKRKGWKTAAGKPVANQELIVRIDALLAGREVRFVYVPAHQVDGDPLNAIADKAASDSAISQQDASGDASNLPVPGPVVQKSRPARKPANGSTAAAGGNGGPRGGSSAGGAAGGGSGSGSSSASGGGRVPTVKARFAGTCSCGRGYGKGELIGKGPSGWGHLDCAKSPSGATG
ncbi:ribonuclease H family protein [Phaeacidiphilus oryzae]|uniref:ribonuclease H family protein n=1 Tax=Phaeacidiphilus oryzae TaxID=348818 RepID=UPI00056AE2B1|nr:ribonuclease H [Phaeacidiphilus oryzae]